MVSLHGWLPAFGYYFWRFRRTAAIWAVSLAAYIGILIAIYPSYSKTALNVDMLPEYMRQAFNITDLNSLAAFLNMEFFSYAPLVIAFFPIMAATAALAGEAERGGLDTLLGTPLSRGGMVLGLWCVLAVLLAGILLLSGAATWGLAAVVGEPLGLAKAFRGSLNLFPIALAAGSLALVLAGVLRQRGTAVGIAFGLLFLMYLLNVVAKIANSLSWLGYASVFRYYGSAILDGTNWMYAAVLVVIALVLLVGAVLVFTRRDIYA